MREVKVFDKGEHVMMELEVIKAEYKSGEFKFKLKVPGKEDYLDSEYTADQLVPIDQEQE
ncbi:MAG: hypothetical protein IJ821_04805 [Lachnospiraceae bacterium]|nr:hypothetical protein [Lachnospiraceae bacterium]